MQLFYERKEEGLHVLAVQTTIAVAACLDWLCTARRRRSLLKSCTCKKSRVFRRRHLSLIVRVRDTVCRFPRRYLPLLPTSFLHKTRDCGWCFRRILHSYYHTIWRDLHHHTTCCPSMNYRIIKKSKVSTTMINIKSIVINLTPSKCNGSKVLERVTYFLLLPLVELGLSFVALAFRPRRCFIGWCWSMSVVFCAHYAVVFWDQKKRGCMYQSVVQTR